MLKPWQTAYLLYDQFRISPKKPVFLAGMDDFKAYLPHLKLEKEGDEAFLFIDDAKKTAVYLQKTATATKAVINQVPIPNEIEQFLKNKFGSNLEVNAVSATSNQNIENGDTLFAIEMLLHCANKKELPPKEINKKLLRYQNTLKDIASQDQSVDFLNSVREWQTLTSEHFLPEVIATPLYNWKLIPPTTLQLTNPPSFDWELIFKNIPNVKISTSDDTLSVTAENTATLKNAFDALTQEKMQWQLLQQGHSELLALSNLAEEAKEILEIAHIQREEKGGGLGIDQVNYALKYFLSNRPDIKILTEQDDLSKIDLKQYQYITFSFGTGDIHQVAVIIDIAHHKIMQLDSENKKDTSALEAYFAKPKLKEKFKDYKIESVTPSAIQSHQWECGLYVERNVLSYFGQSFFDSASKDFITELRTIIRTSKYSSNLFHQSKITEDKLTEIKKILADVNESLKKTELTTEQLTLVRNAIESEIALTESSAISRYQRQQQLMQLFESYQQQQEKVVWPQEFDVPFKFYSEKFATDKLRAEALAKTEGKAPENIATLDKTTFDHILMQIVAEHLINFKKMQVDEANRLQSDLQDRNVLLNKRNQLITNHIADIEKILGEKTNIFREVLEKQGVRLTNLPAEYWALLLKNFPDDPKYFEDFLTAIQTELAKNTETEYLSALLGLKVDDHFHWMRSKFDLKQHPRISTKDKYTRDFHMSFLYLFRAAKPEDKLQLLHDYPQYATYMWFDAVKELPKEHRFTFLLEQKLDGNQPDTSNKLKELIGSKLFDDKEKIIIIDRHLDSALKEFHLHFYYFRDLLKTVSPEVKKHITEKLKENINNFSKLYSVLELFEKEEITSLIEQHKDKILTSEQATQLMTYYSSEKQLPFLLSVNHLFENFKDVYHAARKLSATDDMKKFFLAHKEKVQSGEELKEIMLLIKEQQPSSFAMQFEHVLKTIKDAFDFSSNFAPKDKAQFLQGFVKNSEDLEQTLAALPQAERMSFLEKNSQFITLPMLENVLNRRLFDVNDIQSNLVKLTAHITDFDLLMRFNKSYIRDNQRQFVVGHQRKISTVDHVVLALPFMQPKKKYDSPVWEFAIQFIDLIKTDEDLEKIVSQLKTDTDKEKFLTSYLDKNKTFNGIKNTLKLVSPQERMKHFDSVKSKLSLQEIGELLDQNLFDRWQKNKILKEIKFYDYDLKSVLPFIEKFLPEGRYQTLSAISYKVSTVDELLQVLPLLSGRPREWYASSVCRQLKNVNFSEIKLVANQLEDKNEFLKDFHNKAQTLEQVFEYLELFDDPQQRLSVFQNHFLESLVYTWKEDFFTKMPETLKSNYEDFLLVAIKEKGVGTHKFLLDTMMKLDKENREQFVDDVASLIKNVSDLAKYLELYVERIRHDVALDYLEIIKSKEDCETVLNVIPNERKIDYALAIIPKLKDMEEAKFIAKFLPDEQSQQKFLMTYAQEQTFKASSMAQSTLMPEPKKEKTAEQPSNENAPKKES